MIGDAKAKHGKAADRHRMARRRCGKEKKRFEMRRLRVETICAAMELCREEKHRRGKARMRKVTPGCGTESKSVAMAQY